LKLADRIRRYAARHALWMPGTRVVAAVSGGSDSVALFVLLRELAAAGDLTLAGLAHLNHHIRGAAADEDAAFCRAIAERCGVPSVIGDEDVPARAARTRASIEVAGRDARHAFYAAAMTDLAADVVALAHTRDDQAETVLLRLTRGAGTTGLGAMAPRSGTRIRPLLDLTRAELRAYLDECGEPWREDATNRDRANPRNLLRHDVLPILRSVNPQVDAALARTADILRADAALLEAIAEEAAARLVVTRDGRVEVDRRGLAALPTAIARRVARCALETANPDRSYGLDEADALCRAAAASPPASLPGLVMEHSGAAVVLAKRGATGGPPPLARSAAAHGGGWDAIEPRTLSVPGELTGPHGAWVVTAEVEMGTGIFSAADSRKRSPSPYEVAVDAARIGDTLVVRGRRPGDRFQPLGSPGRRKLQDVLVDRKVPRELRDLVPIVTDTEDQIVWVAGHALAEPFRVTPLTRAVVVLRLRQGS
jgi:tRNA(Ile)-lysidine synthase